MILYFSATGNGKYISEQIAEKTNETYLRPFHHGDFLLSDRPLSSW